MEGKATESPVIMDPEQYILSKILSVMISPAICDTPEKRTVAYDTYYKLNEKLSELPRTVFGTTMSCGVSYLSGLHQTPENIVYKVLNERTSNDKNVREAFVVFSDVNDLHDGGEFQRDVGGNALARYIRANKLGDIVDLPGRKNPNSGNIIRVWLWAPPHQSLGQMDRFMPVSNTKLTFNERGSPVYTPITSNPFKAPSAFDSAAREA